MFWEELIPAVIGRLGGVPLPVGFAAAGDLAVDQPAHRLHPFPVLRAVLAVRPRQRLKPPQPPDRMFHPDAAARKRGVIGDVCGGPLLAARFFARRSPQSRRMGVRTRNGKK